MEEELENHQALKKETSTLLQMDKEEVKLMDELFMIDSVLFREKVIAKEEYLKKNVERINKTKLHQQNILSYTRTEMDITRMRNAVQELKSK